jgi:phosphoribosylamine--glycine ligase
LAVVGIEDTLVAAEQVAEEALTHVKGRVYVRHDIGKKDVVTKRVLHMESVRDRRD